jgi:hypothetical protein
MGTMAVLLTIWRGSTVQATERAPQLLLHTAQCLSAKQFLAPTRAKSLAMGFLLDEESYPGDKAIYVVSYLTTTGSSGFAFTVFLTERGPLQTFNIQNNARFVLSNQDQSGVTFVDEPLGGIWTQQHLTAAIKQIERQPRFTVPVNDLSRPDASIRCEAYTDPQRKGARTRRPFRLRQGYGGPAIPPRPWRGGGGKGDGLPQDRRGPLTEGHVVGLEP